MNEEFKTGMVVDETMKADLLSAAKWAKFLCIVGCIGWLFLVIAGIAMIVLGGKCGFPCGPEGCNPQASPLMGGLGIFTGILYLVCALIMIYPLAKGFQFANGTKAACLTGSEAQLARGFAGMRAYLKFTGILTIIVLVIYLIMGIVAGIGFLAMQNGAQ